MPLNWVNIRSGLKATAQTEPQIAALWSSSDHSPNITQGQDYGWRLAPEVVVELKKLKQDMGMLERIATRFGKALEDIGEIDILTWISNKTDLDAAPEVDVADYEDDYDEQIRALEGKGRPQDIIAPANPAALTTDELEAELARRAALVAADATTLPPVENATGNTSPGTVQ